MRRDHRRAFRLLAEKTVIRWWSHCVGGRDRTGVAAALVLKAAGVYNEDIAADFMPSNHYLSKRTAAFAEQMPAEGLEDEEIERILTGIALWGRPHPREARPARSRVLRHRRLSCQVGIRAAEVAAFRRVFVRPAQGTASGG